MNKRSSLPILLFATAMAASAAPCGTVASPSSCIVSVGGVLQYEFSNFQFINTAPSGGGDAYQPGDVNIDVGSGGGLTGLITFSKNVNGPTLGTVFAANAGETTGVRFSYDVNITALQPGTVSFLAPETITLLTSSSLNNGSASIQMVVTNPPNGVSCDVLANGSHQDDCVLPPGTTTFLRTGDLMTLFGGTGNASVGSYSNLYHAEFAADTSQATPEPSSFALIGIGLAALRFCRRR